ncbi:visual pigment-like receptor peropsin [Triplophysa rosa]|uniref:visual pigment-like receptor peropsin n=1 Tax=Triplophysa rosa TaxID=992332 RepID=UPI0025463135|nr:visual pigment-like receptor peropsin [Triplophysa rosa]
MALCDKEMESGFLNSSESFPYVEKSAFTQTEHNIVAAYLITAGVVSLSSNIVVLLMFVKFRELRNATNAIIINLALTDIGVAGIGYPMSAASDLHGSWKFGYTGCQGNDAIECVGWAGYAPDPTGATCTINWRNNDSSFVSYTMAVITINFIIPLSVMFYCYYSVSVTVKRYKANNCLDSINMDWSDQMDVTKVPMTASSSPLNP